MRTRGKCIDLSCSRTAHTRHILISAQRAVLGACAQLRPNTLTSRRGEGLEGLKSARSMRVV